MTLIPNRPSEEGRALGKEMARLTDLAEAEDLKRFPKQRWRCGTCAFRLGTIPNGCTATMMDAVKCMVEGLPFMCHESPKGRSGEPTQVCAGWMAGQGAVHKHGPPIETPWPFSVTDDDRDELLLRGAPPAEGEEPTR